jgi:hypothetical protein
VKALPTYTTVNNNLDLIALLGLIQASMYTNATSKDTIHSLIEAMEHFYIFKQTIRMDNATCTFQSHIDAINHLNGDFGIHLSYVRARIQEARGDLNDVAACKQTKAEVRKEFVAKYFLLKSLCIIDCYDPK